MRFKEINNITESINDKGIFKAMFFSGMPGAGKSSVASRITDGTVSPRMVNTDRGYEYLLKKHGKEASSAAWELLGQSTKTINESSLANYINGMLPLYVDGTSGNPSALLRRAGLIESFGYDTTMVWVDIDFETAVERMEGRERKVDLDYMKKVFSTVVGNKELFKNRFGANFIEVDNNGDQFDRMEASVYSAAAKFFEGPLKNPIGSRILEQGDKYLVPTTYSEEYIRKMTGVWYTQ